MSRWLIVVMLGMVSASARAQSVPSTTLTAATENAASVTSAAEQQVTQLALQSAALEKRYNSEVDAIDRLKRQRSSWRRQREIQDSLSSSLETSNRLEATSAALKKAKTKLDSTRRNYLAAIDAELAGAPTPSRGRHLSRVRAFLYAQVKAAGAPRHIMIPDLSIDPLADPEELDQRAAELRESERQLTQQVALLDAQAGELERTAQLRKHADRAVDLVTRYEDAPQRRATGTTPDERDPVDGPGPSHLPVAQPSDGRASGADGAIAPDEMIDTTIEALESRASQRSADPAQRAEAARKLHQAVARRLEQVRHKRIEAENRARMLRKR